MICLLEQETNSNLFFYYEKGCSMEILKHAISLKAETIINELLSNLKCTVSFHDMSEINQTGFGACDTANYKIYLKEDLYGVPFETNVLHELYHLCQHEEGFPTTLTLVNNITRNEQHYFNGLGSAVTSSLYDLDVYRRLMMNDYDSSYFHKYRFKKLKDELSAPTPFNCNDKYDFAYWSANCVTLLCAPQKNDFVLSQLKKVNSRLYYSAYSLYLMFCEKGYTDARSSLVCIAEAFKALDIWDVQDIQYKGQIFHSYDEVVSFLS